jgi:hypothetical protein
MKLYLVMAELVREAGSTRTERMKGTFVIWMVKPEVKMSIILPSKVMVYILKVSVGSRVSGLTIPGIVNW